MHILARLVRGRPLLLSSAVLTAAVGTTLKLAPLVAIYFLAVQLLSGDPSRRDMQAIILWTLAAMALRWILLVAANSLAHVAAYNLLHDLRITITRRLAELPLGIVLAQDSGDLKRVMQEDIEKLEMFLGHMIPDVSGAAATLIAGAILLFSVDPVMACAAFAPLPMAILLQAFLWRGSRPVLEAYSRAAGRMNSGIVEFIRAIPVIKTFGRKGAATAELQTSISDFQRLVADFSDTFAPAWVGFTVVIGSGLFFILPVGGWKLVHGTTDIPTFILFLLIGVGLMQNLVEVMTFGSQMRTLVTGLERIDTLMTAPVLDTPEKGITPKSHTLSFNNVSFSYDKGAPVLHAVTFDCPEGKTTAIAGPSGAGKSTLAQLAVRFWDTDNGDISIGGVPLTAMTPETLNRLTASVFQDVFLFRDTVLGNIRAGRPDAPDDEVFRASRAAQIHDFIMSLPDGYDTMLGERGARLSGGQKQRISIARAILKDAPVIILDEATAHADPLNEKKIHAAIGQLCTGKTVLIIAHRLGTIRNADGIVVLDNGSVTGRGRHEELLESNTTYQRLWQAWKATGQPPEPKAASGTKEPAA